MAAVALAAILPSPFLESHPVISSIAAAKPCWLCRSKVSASAVAMLASELSGMAIVPEWWCGNPSSSRRWPEALFQSADGDFFSNRHLPWVDHGL